MKHLSYDEAWAKARRDGKGFDHPQWGWVGPAKANKGQEGGACNRSQCQREPANCFNTVTARWYCKPCAQKINEGANPPFVRIAGEPA